MQKRKETGMTLVEVLIVLVIVAILAAIMLPSYQSNVRKAGRAAAKGALMDIAMRQEQYFINNKSYASSLPALGLPDPYYIDKATEVVSAAASSRAYQLTLSNTSVTSYDAVASTVHTQTSDGCGNYTLKADGARSVSGSIDASVCW